MVEREAGGPGLTRDRIRGCLLGGAIGDALGAPVEVLPLDWIRERLGAEGVTDFGVIDGVRGAITDDTQMTLFTAEGLIRARQRSDAKGIAAPVGVLHHAYLRWLDTQGVTAERSATAAALESRGWLVDEPVLRHRRLAGGTCISALRSGRRGTRDERINDSKGCGGVMRVAPVGLVAPDPFGLAADAAAITHGHPSGFLAAGAFAVVIHEAARGRGFAEAIAIARSRLAGEGESQETVEALDAAVAAAGSGPPLAETVEAVGGGWVAEEALAIAVYCVLAEPDPRRALLLAVNHSGDSDSTGALVGQLLGARHGVEALPAEWRRDVEAAAVVEAVAEDLARRFLDGAELDGERYPGV